MSAPSQSDNGDVVASLMQDADEEIEEEQLLHETAEKELNIARRAAIAASAACAEFDEESDEDGDGGSDTDDDDDGSMQRCYRLRGPVESASRLWQGAIR